MKNFLHCPVGRLRMIALIEGVSFLLLLGIAMPLKYGWGYDQAVRWTGWAHGLLFVLFCVALALAMQAAKWPIWKAGIVFVAALLPFGPFLIDHRLRDDSPRN
ncbi:MAG: DUF3817 domain-containing protein [Chthoniobacterales bacterium]